VSNSVPAPALVTSEFETTVDWRSSVVPAATLKKALA